MDAYFCVLRFTHNQMVVGRVDGATVFHFGASCHCVGGRSGGDAFSLTEEVTLVGWLVVTYWLGHHGIAVLVVRPEGGDAVGGGMGCGEDA